MALSIINVEHDARQADQDDQIRLIASVLSDALRMPMMADSRAEVDTLLERFIDSSPGAMIYLHWANGKSEQFGAGNPPDAVSSLPNLHLRAAFIKGQDRWYAQSINFNKTNLGTITLYLPTPTQDIYTGEIKFLLVMIALLLALLGGGLAYRLTGGLSMLMRLLSKASKQVGAGDFSIHIPSDGRGELGQVFGDFNQMVSQLAQRQVTLELFGHYQNPQQISDGFDRTLINTNCPTRTVAVMVIEMVDFVGYMTTARDSGGLSELNRIFSILDNIISANGGHIDHFSGGRLVAIFNHHFNLKNYQDRAAITSLAVIEASKKLSLHQSGRDAVEFKVGLVQGEVLTGYLGAGRHREFKATGAPVLLAEQLVMLGSGSDVIAGGEILKQLGYGFGQDDLGIQTLASGQNLHVASIQPATQRLLMEVHNSASAAINEHNDMGIGEDASFKS
jgi:class 3 adenylate cyclase